MVFLLLGAIALALLIWAGRQPRQAGGLARIARGLFPLGGAKSRSPRGEAMTQAEACSILGVAPGAPQDEIEAAWRRLMRRAHPDLGGSQGLAAQLNAARARLKK